MARTQGLWRLVEGFGCRNARVEQQHSTGSGECRHKVLRPQVSKDELLESLVSEGKTQEEAVRIIEDLGYEWRVASIDGVPQPTTRDYREDRVTMDIDDGIVVGARWE